MSRVSRKRKDDETKTEPKAKKARVRDRPIWHAYFKIFYEDKQFGDGVSEEFFRDRENAKCFIREQMVDYCDVELGSEGNAALPPVWITEEGTLKPDVPFEFISKALKEVRRRSSARTQYKWFIVKVACCDESDSDSCDDIEIGSDWEFCDD